MKKAFTIVELLVVMAVIGILISLSVVGIQAIQKSQRETVRANDLRNITATLAEYYAGNKVYPRNYSWFVVGADQLSICMYDYPAGWFPGVDANCSISYKGTGFFNKVNIGQYGFNVYGSLFTNQEIKTTVTAPGGDCENPKTAESWTIYYKTASPTPQQFGLYACTENGLTENFGELK